MLCVLIRIASSSTHNIQLLCKTLKYFPNLSLIASPLDSMINPQWHEQPISRTNFHGPKDVRAIEVRLYLNRLVFVIVFYFSY